MKSAVDLVTVDATIFKIKSSILSKNDIKTLLKFKSITDP